MLVGALSHSGRFRGVFCEQMTFGHLAEAMHRVLVALGGTPRVVADRSDGHGRDPGHRPADRRRRAGGQALRRRGRGLPAAAARSARASSRPRSSTSTRSWWRSARSRTMAEAQRSIWIAGASTVADQRQRPAATVGELGAGEPLRALPAAAYPALIAVERKVARARRWSRSRATTTASRPATPGARVTVRARVGEPRPADRLRRGRADRDAPPRPGGRRPDDPQRRARRRARARRPGRVHHRPRLPAQGQPAARPGTRSPSSRACSGLTGEPAPVDRSGAATPQLAEVAC